MRIDDAPKHLTEPEAAEWHRLAALFRDREPFDELDRDLLADYAVCLVRLHEAEVDIRQRGLLVPGDRGLVKNPACQLARQYRDALMARGRELRDRLAKTQPADASASLDELLSSLEPACAARSRRK